MKTDYKLPEWFTKTIYSVSKNPFYVLNDTLCFEQKYNGDVYSISPDDQNLISRYSWDFGPYNFTLSELPADKSVEEYLNLSKRMQANYAVQFQIYKENSEYYFTRFKFKNRYKHLIYSKKNKEYKLFDSFKEGTQCLPLAINEDILYTFISPALLHFVVNPDMLDELNQKKYHRIEDVDNPIIVKFTFKKDEK